MDNALNFDELRSHALEILESIGDYDYEELKHAEMKTLISYEHRAAGKSGVGKATGSRAVSLEYLQSLPDGYLADIVANPPFDSSPAP